MPPSDEPIAGAERRLRDAFATAPALALPRLETILNGVCAEDVETLRLVAALVREIAPRHVVVFGCDAACELLALLGFEDGRLAVTVYEHDPWAAEEWINAASPFAINYRWFSFCICPLVARPCGGALRPVYDDGMTLPVVPHPADLILINGPPDELGGRGGVIYQALSHAREGTIVLVLDARRGEDQMFEAWAADLEEYLQFSPPGLLGRHLAFITLKSLPAPIQIERPRAQAAAREASAP